MHRLLADPWVAAQIDAAVEPYRRLWTEREVAIFREQMAETLATNPAAIAALRDAHPEIVDASGEARVVPEDVDETAQGGRTHRSAG
jgi:hypothetical protein